MKRQNKIVSLVMAVMFCITFLAPVLVAPAPALAASTYTVLRSVTLSNPGTDYLGDVLVQVDVPSVSAVKAGDKLTFSLPVDFTIGKGAPNNGGTYTGTVLAQTIVYQVYNAVYTCGTNGAVTSKLAYSPSTVNSWTTANYSIRDPFAAVRVMTPETLENGQANMFYRPNAGAGFAHDSAYTFDPLFEVARISNQTFEIIMTDAWGSAAQLTGAGRFNIYMKGVSYDKAVDGDVTLLCSTPTGTGFTSSAVTIAKTVGSTKGTSMTVKSVKSMSTSATSCDSIVIVENPKNSLTATNQIKLKLPSGFIWSWASTNTTPVLAAAGWDFTNGGFACTSTDSSRTFVINLTGLTRSGLTEGRILVGNLAVRVDDESVAKKGDVSVTISDNLGEVTGQTATLMNYKDYSVEVKEVSTKEVIAGYADTELGAVELKEGLAGSILAGRTISFTLPSGVKWDYINNNSPTYTNVWNKKLVSGPDFVTASGAGNPSYDSTFRVLKITIGNTVWTSASDMIFEKMKVMIDPSFSGDLVVEVGGTAGVTGKAKVATVKTAATLASDKTPDIIIGAQNQALGTITIKEAKKEIFKGSTGDVVRLELPTGAEWATKGTVTVSEGDATIDKVSTSGANMDITIKSTSSVPATIKVEGAKVTLNRTVPEGNFELALKANNTAAAGATEANGIVERRVASIFNVNNVATIVAGKVVTPAPQQTLATAGSNGAFTVGQKWMIVNGQYKTVDVAPFIEDGRTFVPVRALSDALGAAIVWDAATQKATITKGTSVIELVIGSKTAKVNGADQPMDVAPKVVSGRTMLPARVVCEGLGFKVEYDAASKQVVFGM